MTAAILVKHGTYHGRKVDKERSNYFAKKIKACASNNNGPGTTPLKQVSALLQAMLIFKSSDWLTNSE